MAAPQTGNGGYVDLAAGTRFDVITHRLTKRAKLVETTDSGTSGRERWAKIVTGADISVDFFWDSDNIPDTDVTLDAGDTVVYKPFLGGSGKFYSVSILVETLEIVNDNANDVIRGTFTGKANGAITDPIT